MLHQREPLAVQQRGAVLVGRGVVAMETVTRDVDGGGAGGSPYLDVSVGVEEDSLVKVTLSQHVELILPIEVLAGGRGGGRRGRVGKVEGGRGEGGGRGRGGRVGKVEGGTVCENYSLTRCCRSWLGRACARMVSLAH